MELGRILRGIVTHTLVVSAAGACWWSSTGEKFTSAIRPRERQIPIDDHQCDTVCDNFRATQCHFTLENDNSVKLACRGEHDALEARGRKPGDDCHYQMGHPDASSCRYTAERDGKLTAEWEFHFSSSHVHPSGRLVLEAESCTPWCGRPMGNCEIVPQKKLQTICDPHMPGGRRPPGFEPAQVRAASVGHFLRRAAELEAASVAAFRQLARELAHHGAPAELVARARVAAREEARHFRALRRLAAARGAQAEAPRVPSTPPRSLLALAIDNVVEGCVRETFGALCALWQAHRAPTAELRATLARIADDEIGHAELSWDLGRWLTAQLAAADRQTLRAEARAAVEQLAAEHAVGFSEPLCRELGVPTARETAELLAGLRAQVFAF